MPNISHNLVQIHQRIAQCALKNATSAQTPLILAVSKTKPASSIIAAYEAGQRDFGENYAQELADKAEQLKDLNIIWHFIGPIQSNKSRLIARYSHWVHSIDRVKIAERLNAQRPEHMPPLQVCIQVNIDQEETKSGINESELDDLVTAINKLPNLTLRGLMVIPNAEDPKPAFNRLAALAQKYQLSTLSMGMSDDMEDAIAAGSTIVRIGTAIFGSRQSAPTASSNLGSQQQ